MNWLIFALAAYVALVLESGLGVLLSVGGVAPSFVLVLAVYVGLLAPGSVVPWAMLVLGVLADLLWGPIPGAGAVILGPAALGYLAGAFAVLQLRALVFRESVITLAAMVFAVGIFVQLVTVALLSARGLPWPTADPLPAWHLAEQLERRFLELLYTAVLAVPVGFALLRSTPAWGFPTQRHH